MVHVIMKRFGFAFLLATGLLLLPSCNKGKDADEIKAEIVKEVSPAPVLYTVKARAQVIVTEQDEPGSIKRYFGDRVVLIPVSATLKAGVDLSRIETVIIDRADNSIHVTLPPPVIEIESTTIDNSRIVTEVAPFRYNFSEDEIARIALKGRERIKDALPQMDLVRPAQEEAARMLVNICEKLGYTNIVVDIPDYDSARYGTFLKLD